MLYNKIRSFFTNSSHRVRSKNISYDRAGGFLIPATLIYYVKQSIIVDFEHNGDCWIGKARTKLDNHPLPGAEIWIGEPLDDKRIKLTQKVTTTDQEGYFSFPIQGIKKVYIVCSTHYTLEVQLG